MSSEGAIYQDNGGYFHRGWLLYSCYCLFSGLVNITLSTEALATKELCGKERPFVPARGRTDTLIKPLLVQVSLGLSSFSSLTARGEI